MLAGAVRMVMIAAVTRRLLPLIFAGFVATQARATPLGNLASPVPQIREAAAEAIRAQGLYHPTPSPAWKSKLGFLKQGAGIQETLSKLEAMGVPGVSASFGGLSTGTCIFRVDDTWELFVSFQGGQFLRAHLVSLPRTVRVQPPLGFTGCWSVYRIDGTRELQYYIDGRQTGAPTGM